MKNILRLMFKVYHQFIFRFSLFGQSDQKRKTSCPVYLLFTEKVNCLLANKEKKFSVKTGFEELKKSKQTGQLIFSFLVTLTK